MSITAALSNAVSGLTAASRSAEVVSSNVANAMTEGYGRREINLSARVIGGAGAGVQVDGVNRVVDEAVLRDRRLADASAGYYGARTDFFEGLEGLAGTPDDPNSLSGSVARFEASLIEAASRPDLDSRLSASVNAAANLAQRLGEASEGVQTARLDADRDIATMVEKLNSTLQQVQDLNATISRLNGAGRDVTALQDNRQQLIDQISSIVPVREIPREDGKVSLYTTGGAILLQDTAVEIGFNATNLIVPDMTQASGALSGLTINGRPVSFEGSYAPLKGGTLAAAFDVRDTLAPQAQERLDAIARDLVERFQDPNVDPTLTAGDAGFFTDAGGAFDPLNEVGLSQRLSLNAAIDPAQGGALWRMRDGIGATVQGDVGNATLLNQMATALSTGRTPASGDLTASARSAGGLAAEFLSIIGKDLRVAENNQSYSVAQQQSLQLLERSNGVDTDQEMQKLLLIEQAFAANARVIQTADEMIQTLLRL